VRKSKASSQVVGIRLPRDVIGELDKLAAEYGENRATVVRTLLEQASCVYRTARKMAIEERNHRDAQVEEIVRKVEKSISKDELTPTLAKMTFEMVKTVMQKLMEDAVKMHGSSE